MKFYSTNKKSEPVSFEKAVMAGLADDGGLFMPQSITVLDKNFIDTLDKLSFREIALEIVQKFVEGEINGNDLENIINEAINFPAPVIPLDDKISVLELFHGPTLAFKDFGARFMAKTMGHFISKQDRELNILVATSGDTGSAVAKGFYDTAGINVYILYPKGKVSYIQEKQLTTLDKNITALEIDGTFDDCQSLVKSAFVDSELSTQLNLSSANSINFARLLPQTFYYFEAYRQVKNKSNGLIICVPSGNLGNLTAGLIAKKMGLPVTKFIAATNANSGFAEYIKTGSFIPRKSILTLSNAMDVGNPSNLERIRELFNNDLSEIQKNIFSNSADDKDTLKTIKSVFDKHNYILDPHGAVGYFILNNFLKNHPLDNFSALLLETAHPAKFLDVVEKEVRRSIEIPERLKVCLNKDKRSVPLSNDYSGFRDYLLSDKK